MKAYIRSCASILSILLTIGTGIVWPQANNEIRQIQIQQFDRFWRLSFYLARGTTYQLADFSEQNRIVLSVPARLASGVQVPQIGAMDISVQDTAAGSQITIDLPQPFKFDHFYFPPNQKIVVDFYPIFEYASATQSYEMAVRAMSKGDTARAIRLYKTALLQNPDLKNALLRLGQVYFWRQDTAAARVAFQQLIGYSRPDIESRAITYLDSLRLLQAQNADQRGIAAEQVEEAPPADSLVAIAVADSMRENNSKEETKTVVEEAKEFPLKPQPIIVARRKISRPLHAQLLTWLEQIPLMIPFFLIAFVALIGVIFWLLAIRPRSIRKRRGNEAQRISRLLKLIEKGREGGIPGVNDQAAQSEEPADKRVNVIDESEASPFSESGDARIARLRNLVNEAVLPERRLPRTPPRVRRSIGTDVGRTEVRGGVARRMEFQEKATNKRQVLQMALQGKSVTQIARELGMGVGEVELILGFGRGRPTITDDENSSLDFGI